jgi:predicted amidohydrolase
MRFVASAKVVDPGGDVLASTGTAAGMAVAELDVAAALNGARRAMAHLRDRRPHAYTPVGASPARPETVADGAPVAAA